VVVAVMVVVVVVVACGTWLNSENNRTQHGTCGQPCAFHSFTTAHLSLSTFVPIPHK
jgi:hypothetical protein